jgi:hypothetical protein
VSRSLIIRLVFWLCLKQRNIYLAVDDAASTGLFDLKDGVATYAITRMLPLRRRPTPSSTLSFDPPKRAFKRTGMPRAILFQFSLHRAMRRNLRKFRGKIRFPAHPGIKFAHFRRALHSESRPFSAVAVASPASCALAACLRDFSDKTKRIDECGAPHVYPLPGFLGSRLRKALVIRGLRICGDTAKSPSGGQLSTPRQMLPIFRSSAASSGWRAGSAFGAS